MSAELPQLRAAIFVSKEEAHKLFLQLGKRGEMYEAALPRILAEMATYGCSQADNLGHPVQFDVKLLEESKFAAQLNFSATPENFGGVPITIEATRTDLVGTANQLLQA